MHQPPNMQETIYAILHRPSGSYFWGSGSKCGWVSEGAAKNAWFNAKGTRFADQSDFVVVPLHACLAAD